MSGIIIGKCTINGELNYGVLNKQTGEIDILTREEVINAVKCGQIKNAKYIEKSDTLRGVGCSLALLPTLKLDEKPIVKELGIKIRKKKDGFRQEECTSEARIILKCATEDGFKFMGKIVKQNRDIPVNVTPNKKDLEVLVEGNTKKVGNMCSKLRKTYDEGKPIHCISYITDSALDDALATVGRILRDNNIANELVGKASCKGVGVLTEDKNGKFKLKLTGVELVANSQDVKNKVDKLNSSISENDNVRKALMRACAYRFSDEANILGLYIVVE